MLKKTTQLKRLLHSPELEFIMEAHNGMSAKIVEEAGFKGIWGSGLSISGSLGVRDNNEASWTQVLDVVEFMSDATHIPILLDGDTGYGNFNNMRRLVQKLEQREVAGVCIEDKLFPKTNSFLRGEAQPLADMEEFCGKIKAGKDTQRDDDFVIVARVEAFIAGWGLEEALKRADAYRLAGADAVLIHSKLAHAGEIFAFTKEWADRGPVVIVPTKFYTTPTDEFHRQHISMVIWANHLFRGAVRKMQEVAGTIYREQNLLNVEDAVVPVKEIFRLQNDQELEEAETLYLRSGEDKDRSAVILAATRGDKLGPLTEELPKAMLKVGRRSILERAVSHLGEYGIKDITAVAGYKKQKIQAPGVKVVENPDWDSSGQMASLAAAEESLRGESLVLFGDILFKKYILQLALADPADFVLVVDTQVDADRDYLSDFITADGDPSQDMFDHPVTAREMQFASPAGDWYGEWIGLLKLSPKGSAKVREFIRENRHMPEFSSLNLRDMINRFIQQGETVSVQSIAGHWVDVNNLEDITLANEF